MSEKSPAKKSLLDRILDAIERAGNKLPDPITMFLGLAIIVTIISAICSAAGVSAVNPADGSTIEVFNLLSLDGIRYLWTNVITNFSGFAPLGMVLVAVIGSPLQRRVVSLLPSWSISLARQKDGSSPWSSCSSEST